MSFFSAYRAIRANEVEIITHVYHFLLVGCGTLFQTTHVHHILRSLAMKLDNILPNAVDDKLKVTAIGFIQFRRRRCEEVHHRAIGVKRQLRPIVCLHGIEASFLCIWINLGSHFSLILSKLQCISEAAILAVCFRIIFKYPAILRTHQHTLCLIQVVFHTSG